MEESMKSWCGAVIAAVAALVLAGCPPVGDTADQWTTLFSDDFNRADSTAVGNGWGQVPQGSLPPAASSISGGKLLLEGGWDTPNVSTPAAVVRTVSLAGDFRVTMAFGFPGDLTRLHLYATTSGMQYYAWGVMGGQVAVWKDSAVLPGGVAVSMDPCHSYTLEVLKEGSNLTAKLVDSTGGGSWTATASDASYQDFTALHLKGGECPYTAGTPVGVSVDDFVLQTE
jgi:hypothetical protein